MARKTVQTKFVSGSIARVDLELLRRAHCCLRPAAAQIRFVSRYHGFKESALTFPKLLFRRAATCRKIPSKLIKAAEINFSDSSSRGTLHQESIGTLPEIIRPFFSRVPSTTPIFESRVPEISGGGETRGTGLGARTRPPWVRLGVNRPAGGGGPSRGALIVHLAGNAQLGRA